MNYYHSNRINQKVLPCTVQGVASSMCVMKVGAVKNTSFSSVWKELATALLSPFIMRP